MSDQVEPEVERAPIFGKKLIIFATALLPIVGYLIGNGFHSSYLSAFGITSGAFQLSIQDTYINSYQSITWTLIYIRDLILSSALSELFEIAVYLFGFIVIMTAIDVLNGRRISKIASAINLPVILRQYFDSSLKLTPISGFVVMVISLFILTLAFPFLLFTLWMLVLVLSYGQGKAIAEKQITEYQENNGCYFEKDKRWGNCIQLNNSKGKLIYEGLLIVQNDRRVAFYNGKESVILEIPSGAMLKNMANQNYKEITKETK
jgi:hypothetical protein